MSCARGAVFGNVVYFMGKEGFVGNKDSEYSRFDNDATDLLPRILKVPEPVEHRLLPRLAVAEVGADAPSVAPFGVDVHRGVDAVLLE